MGALALEDLLAKLFIARKDVRAFQRRDGSYSPDYSLDKSNKRIYHSFTRLALTEHLAGDQTYGHYLLDTDNQCKLFAFDIDFEETGLLPSISLNWENNTAEEEDSAYLEWQQSMQDCNPREIWRMRSHPARPYMKQAMRSLAHVLEHSIADLEIPTTVAYTGNKGLHVYGFTGRLPAKAVREAALIALEALPVSPLKGKAFYKWSDPAHEHALFSIELFPKQDELGSDSGFGNLMRLPLGVNLKAPQDPTFFVDTEQPFGVLMPVHPEEILNQINDRLTEQDRV